MTLGPETGGNDITLSTCVEKEAVAYDQQHELLLLTTIKAPHIANEARDSRAPIDLVAVIDRSGSMNGEKLELVLKTISFVVEQLKATDQLCIIALIQMRYESHVDISLPLTLMSDSGKKAANEKIASIKSAGQTNLSGGLLMGIDQLINRSKKNSVTSIMLFTDGIANCGITTTAPLVAAIQSSTSKIDSACSIFTFGYGADHEEQMLRSIAEAGKGMYYFIENLDDIPKSFGDCLGGLLSVAAQNIFLKLEGLGGVTIKRMVSKISGSAKVVGNSIEVNIGDIYCEETRDILALIALPTTSTPIDGSLDVAEVSLSYFNVVLSSFATKSVTVQLRRPATTPTDQPINLDIDKQRNRITAATAMEQATKICKLYPNCLAQARQVLETAKQFIKSSASANEQLSLALIADLESSLKDLDSTGIASSAAQKKMSQKSLSHSTQRGHSFSGMYDNSMKTSMKLSFSSTLTPRWNHASDSNNDKDNNNNNHSTI